MASSASTTSEPAGSSAPASLAVDGVKACAVSSRGLSRRALLKCFAGLGSLAIGATVVVAEEAVRATRWSLERDVGYFRLHCNFELRDSEMVTRELQALATDATELLRLPAPGSLIHVVLFDTAAEFSRYMNNYFPRFPQRRALFVKDRGPGMLFTYWHDDIAIDLRHEVAHALLNQGDQPLPLWLDEGLAEYFEVPTADRMLNNPFLVAVQARVREGVVPSLARLEEIDSIADFTDVHYRDSWSWAHYCLHRSEATRTLLVEYLDRFRAGERQLGLGRQLQMQTPDLVAAYQEHFRAL